MDTTTSRLHLLALPTELRCLIWSTLIGYQSARLVRESDGAEHLRGEARSSQLLRTCKQVHAEACPIIYANTGFKTSFSSDPKEIWRAVGVNNGRMIKRVEKHVDGYEDCVLYYCTPVYSPDMKLLNVQVTSGRWLGNDLGAHERVERLQVLFTTRTLEAAGSGGRPRVMERIRANGEVHFEVTFGSPKIPFSESDQKSCERNAGGS